LKNLLSFPAPSSFYSLLALSTDCECKLKQQQQTAERERGRGVSKLYILQEEESKQRLFFSKVSESEKFLPDFRLLFALLLISHCHFHYPHRPFIADYTLE
jgi:hypothetical protein